MHLLGRICTVTLILWAGVAPTLASPGKYGSFIKKSPAGICYPPKNSEWGALKKFTPFKTMEDCLKTGGSMPLK